MGLIWDYLNGGKRMRKEREEYEATHICYKAYCRICGETTSTKRTPEEAVRSLQFHSSGCGSNCHDPQIREV